MNSEHYASLYRQSIEDDGLATYILIADWQSPEEIRAQIVDLRNKDEAFEGFVLVGDIPVPIIVRLQGTNAEEGKKLIDESGLRVHSAISLQEAADLVTQILN